MAASNRSLTNLKSQMLSEDQGNGDIVWKLSVLPPPAPQILMWNYLDFVSKCTSFVATVNPHVDQGLGVLNPPKSTEQVLIPYSSPILISSTEQTSGSSYSSPVSKSRLPSGHSETLDRIVEITESQGVESSGSFDMSSAIEHAFGMTPSGEEEESPLTTRPSSLFSGSRVDVDPRYDTSFESTSSLDEELLRIKLKSTRKELSAEGSIVLSNVSESTVESLILANLDPEVASQLANEAVLDTIDPNIKQSSDRDMIDFDVLGSVSEKVLSPTTSTYHSPSVELDSQTSSDQTPKSVKGRGSGKRKLPSRSKELAQSRPFSQTHSQQFVLLQYFPKKEIQSSQLRRFQSEALSSSLEVSQESDLSAKEKEPTMAQYKLKDYLNMVKQNKKLEEAQITASLRGEVRQVNIPGARIRKHVPIQGEPFKRATKVAPPRRSAQTVQTIEVLKTIDVSRLNPPNQYSAAQLRQFASALRIPRSKKNTMIDILKQQLRIARLM